MRCFILTGNCHVRRYENASTSINFDSLADHMKSNASGTPIAFYKVTGASGLMFLSPKSDGVQKLMIREDAT